jgi:hypothetical protein
MIILPEYTSLMSPFFSSTLDLAHTIALFHNAKPNLPEDQYFVVIFSSQEVDSNILFIKFMVTSLIYTPQTQNNKQNPSSYP